MDLLYSLFGCRTKKHPFKVCDKVRIIRRVTPHGYNLYSNVTIVEVLKSSEGDDYYHVINKNGKDAHVLRNEIELL